MLIFFNHNTTFWQQVWHWEIVHEDQDFKSGFWNLKIRIPAFFGKYWWNLYCIIWIILKDYIILYYIKNCHWLLIIHIYQSQKKKTHVENIFYRLDLIRIITLFWGQLVREIKITFFWKSTHTNRGSYMLWRPSWGLPPAIWRIVFSNFFSIFYFNFRFDSKL